MGGPKELVFASSELYLKFLEIFKSLLLIVRIVRYKLEHHEKVGQTSIKKRKETQTVKISIQLKQWKYKNQTFVHVQI